MHYNALEKLVMAIALVLVAGLAWLTTSWFFWDSGWTAAPEEATPDYLQREYAALILPGYTEFQMKFFDPAAKLWSFEYRTPGIAEPLQLLTKRAATRGWAVREVSERELRLEMRVEGETSKRIVRIQMAARSPRLVVLITSAGRGQSADERWNVIQSYLAQKRVNTR
jgi:hypothetical protein